MKIRTFLILAAVCLILPATALAIGSFGSGATQVSGGAGIVPTGQACECTDCNCSGQSCAAGSASCTPGTSCCGNNCTSAGGCICGNISSSAIQNNCGTGSHGSCAAVGQAACC